MALHLYHVTVQLPGAISASETCFFGSNEEHLLLARGQWLEAYRIEEDELVLKCRANVFASIRCIQRVAAQGSDIVALTSDSGDLVLLQYDCGTARFSKLASEALGRSGFRRTVPGEYLAVDPKGRVVMAAAIEKLRSVYVLHGDGISAAVEAPAPSTYCYALVAMDRGYGNPAFASLERFRFGPKAVVMYEFNLGLNHLVKLWTHTVTDDTDVITAVPGGRDGPSGVLIFTGSAAVYLDAASGEPRHELALLHPVVCARTVRVRRNGFFIWLQCVNGSCLKLTLTDEGLACAAFATLPRALDFQILKSGHVFANSESGDHALVQISELDPLRLGESVSVPALAPCVSTSLQRKQLVAVNRSGAKSRVSLVEYGRDIEELVTSPLPGTPSAVYASKRSRADVGHGIIALAFDTTTTFLSVGDDGSVNETSEAETGLASKVRTLGLQCMGDDALVQVHTTGFRYVAAQTFPWLAPKGTTITGCAFTAMQMLLALDTKQVLYFEMRNGTLVESKQRVDLPSTPTCVCFESPLPHELSSTAFYVSCEDEVVRHFALPDLKQQRLYSAPGPVTSMHHKHTLHLGHSNGTLSTLHEALFWTRVLGSGPVTLVPLDGEKLLALSSRNWVITGDDVSPLTSAAPKFTAAHSFVTEDLPDGVLGISGSSLVVFSVPTIGNGVKTTLRHLAVLSSPIARITRNFHSSAWYACGGEFVSVIENNPHEDETSNVFSLSTGSPTLTCSNVRFDSLKKEVLVVVTKNGLQAYEYTGSPPGSRISLLHETRVSECSAILPFKGMLLAAVNRNRLVLYDLGQKQLLRKATIDLADLAMVKVLRATRDKVYVGDARQSVTVLSYNSSGFSVAYQDPVPRSVTAMVLLDHATVCAADQYGNLAILRCGAEALASQSGDKSVNELQLVAHFWVPDGIVDVHKGVLSPVAGVEAILYTGLQGTIGALIPLVSKEDESFMAEVALEVSRRTTTLAGRNSLAFRGYYTPPKNVVDGDLCEYGLCSAQGLGEDDIQELAEAVDSEPSELIRRVQMFRDRSVF